jgi:hypothetical protein
MRWTSRLGLVLLLVVAAGCMIGRRYVGSPLPVDPREVLVVGETTQREVLGWLGPPDRILRQKSGDVFVYRHDQRNESQLEIEEPVFTDLTLFQWEKVQDKSDRLMVFFDSEGVVSAFAYRRGREELEPL